MTTGTGKNAPATRGRPFVRGNPGRPKGARNRSTLAAEALLEGEAAALTRKAVDIAKGGDVAALRLCIERLVPPRKDRPVRFALPPTSKASDHPAALAAVLKAVSAGDITPSEGEAFARILAEHRRAVETADLEQRLAALEARHER